jgi:ribosomal protein L20
MTRVKRGSIARQYRKKILKFNQGFIGSHSILFRIAKQQNIRSIRYSYSDRKKRKRDFRSLWIKRINASSRLNNICYSQLINKLQKTKIMLNRKILSQICIQDMKSFNQIISVV